MTNERVIRETDENLYQPKIHSDLIKELYRIGRETGYPMTKLVDMAIRDFIDAMDFEKDMAIEYDPDRVRQEEPDPNCLELADDNRTD